MIGDRCPHHALIQHCPLYAAGHSGGRLGCVDDMAKPCRVARGLMDYADQVERVRVHGERGLVARCAFNEDAHRMREQRARNMRLNGVH